MFHLKLLLFTFKRKYMSWFFKKQKNSPVVEPVTEAKPKSPTMVVGIPSVSMPSSEYQEKVKSWMEEANEKGLDYYEFSTAIDSLSGQPITEQQKFTVTFAPFVASGITPASLAESAERYLQMINSKSDQFHLELSRALDREVTKRQEAIRQAEQEIATLTLQIEEKAKFIQTTNAEMNKSQADLTMKENAFTATIAQTVEKIKSDIEKIKTHLK